MIVVMGIDPGFANTGFGIVRMAGGSMRAIDAGVIEAPAGASQDDTLNHIRESLSELMTWHQPEAVALEQIYFGKNVRTAIAVGQARGVSILAAAERGVPTVDYTPQEVKLAVCGTGAADKQQVQRMVAVLLGLPQPPRSDHAADALAVAICHAAHARPVEVRRGAASAASKRGAIGAGGLSAEGATA
jgi:crossover junction endodeoxyribonuclease RuvC